MKQQESPGLTLGVTFGFLDERRNAFCWLNVKRCLFFYCFWLEALPFSASLSLSFFLTFGLFVEENKQREETTMIRTTTRKESTPVFCSLSSSMLSFFFRLFVVLSLPWPCLPFSASFLLLAECVSRFFYRTFGLLVNQTCCCSSSLPEGSLLSLSLPVSRAF